MYFILKEDMTKILRVCIGLFRKIVDFLSNPNSSRFSLIFYSIFYQYASLARFIVFSFRKIKSKHFVLEINFKIGVIFWYFIIIQNWFVLWLIYYWFLHIYWYMDDISEQFMAKEGIMKTIDPFEISVQLKKHS